LSTGLNPRLPPVKLGTVPLNKLEAFHKTSHEGSLFKKFIIKKATRTLTARLLYSAV